MSEGNSTRLHEIEAGLREQAMSDHDRLVTIQAELRWLSEWAANVPCREHGQRIVALESQSNGWNGKGIHINASPKTLAVFFVLLFIGLFTAALAFKHT